MFNPYNPLIFPRADTNAMATNGTLSVNPIYTGFEEETLTTSDNINMTFYSNETTLEVIIDVNMTVLLGYYMHFLNPYNISLESSVNSTVNQLDLEVLNHYTGKFDNLGSINNTVETNNKYTFNQEMPPFSYINQSNSILRLRISGQNSTHDSDFSLNLDTLSFLMFNSTFSLNASTWPSYKVIGIVKDPSMSKNERAFWPASVEIFNIVEQTKNTVYINYEDARTYVYPMNEGNLKNGTYDKVTSVLLHIKTVEEIEASYNQLKLELNDVQLGVWTALDLKTPSLDIRTFANDWYIWIEDGVIDEELKDDLIEYIEDEGYTVLFGFTRTFVENMFRGMIDLITTITTGVLVFAIIISMIGLALHSLLSTMARRREIGMLRSIGLSKKGVVRTVSGETIIISLLGAFIGIFAGLLQGYLMVSAVPAASLLKVTFTIPWEVIGGLVGVTILTAIVSSRYPSKWAANLNIIDAVRTR